MKRDSVLLTTISNSIRNLKTLLRIKGHYYLLITIFVGSSLFAFSQTGDRLSGAMPSSNLVVSYNTSLIYPGASIGLELPVKTSLIDKSSKQEGKKMIISDYFIAPKINWYHHPSFHDNLYLTVSFTIRRTHANGLITDFSPAVGISRTFLGGTVYKVDQSGNVSVEKNGGQYYALLSGGYSIGYDLEKINHKLLMLFSTFNLIAMFPYNSTVYFRPVVEIGLKFKLPEKHTSDQTLK
jgi:hypothetical protein